MSFIETLPFDFLCEPIDVYNVMRSAWFEHWVRDCSEPSRVSCRRPCTKGLCAVVKASHSREFVSEASGVTVATSLEVAGVSTGRVDGLDVRPEFCDPKSVFLEPSWLIDESFEGMDAVLQESVSDMSVDEVESQASEEFPSLMDLVLDSYADVCPCDCHPYYGYSPDIGDMDISEICLDCPCYEQW